MDYRSSDRGCPYSPLHVICNVRGRFGIRIFPDKANHEEACQRFRMGKGKGNPEGFVAPVTPGRLIFEIEGVPFGDR